MADPFADFDDIKNMFFPPLDPSKTAYVNSLLAQASTAIRARVPNVDDRIAAGTLSADTVTLIACRVVFRFLGTGGQRLKAEQTGPFRREFFESGGVDALDLTEGELAALAFRSPSGLGSAKFVRWGEEDQLASY